MRELPLVSLFCSCIVSEHRDSAADKEEGQRTFIACGDVTVMSSLCYFYSLGEYGMTVSVETAVGHLWKTIGECSMLDR